jgi:hypothetical protein
VSYKNARKGTRGLPPPVKLEIRRLTYTVLVRRKTQQHHQQKQMETVPDIFSSQVLNTKILNDKKE